MAKNHPPAQIELRRFGFSSMFGTLLSITPVSVHVKLQGPPPEGLEPGQPLKQRFPELPEIPDLDLEFARCEKRGVDDVLVFGFGPKSYSPGQLQTLTALMDQRGATRFMAPHPLEMTLHAEGPGVPIPGRLFDLSTSGLGMVGSQGMLAGVPLGSLWEARIEAQPNIEEIAVQVGVRGLRKQGPEWCLGLEVLAIESAAQERAHQQIFRCVQTWRNRLSRPA